jgi:predicted Zn-dependent peptidase
MDAKRILTKTIWIAVIMALVTFSMPAAVNAEDMLKLPAVKKITLKNGMTILLIERPGVPIVSLNFIIKAGSVSDPIGKEGLASLTAEMLRKGTKTRTATQISNELDFVGGELGVDAAADYSRGVGEFVKKDLNTGIAVLTDILMNPTFPQDEVDKLKTQTIDALKSEKDDASSVIGDYYNAFLFGDHPYGRPTDGTEKSVATITRDDIQKFYHSYYGPGNMILSVAGDFKTPEMETILTKAFDEWQGKTSAQSPIPEPTSVKGRRLLLVDKPDSTQTFFMIGNLGVARNNQDRVYINVINTLFGGRFTSLLNAGLRINSGLTYGARSFFDQRKVAGPFAISTYTANETTEKAMDMALVILKDLHEKGITEEQLKSAKNYIKGQYPPRIETSDQLASLMTTLEFYGADEGEVNGLYAKIDSMTLSDANRIIKQYFPQDNLVFVLIGKGSEIQTLAKKYAPEIKTKSISAPGY